MDINQKNRAGM